MGYAILVSTLGSLESACYTDITTKYDDDASTSKYVGWRKLTLENHLNVGRKFCPGAMFDGFVFLNPTTEPSDQGELDRRQVLLVA